MHIAVRARRLVVMHPSIYWIVFLLLAVTAGWIVRDQLAGVDHARRSWGDTRQVIVASTNHEPGQPLQIERVDMPIAMVPPGAIVANDVDGISPPITRQRIGVGEIVVASDITSASGPAALAEPGTAVVGVIDPHARNVAIGLDVAVASDGVLLAHHALVVDLVDDVIFISVDEPDAPAVAAAAHDGAASLIFIP